MSPSRLEAVDFTFPHWMEPSAVALKLHSHKWNYFTAPLDLNLWLMYFCLPFVMATVLLIMTLFRVAALGETEWLVKARFHSYCFDFMRYIFNQGKRFCGHVMTAVFNH